MKQELQKLFRLPVKDIVSNYAVNKKQKEFPDAAYSNALREVTNYMPLPYENLTGEKIKEKIVKEWFAQKIRKRYDELSPEIFDLKFTLRKIDGRDYADIEIPLFARANMLKDKEWRLRKRVSYRYDYDDYTMTVTSKMPNIPLDVRKAGREALAHAYKAYGEAINTETLGDIVLADTNYVPKPENAELVVLWKPRPEDLDVKIEVVDKDPALVLNYDRPYLVKTWDEPNEEPFMNLIAAAKLPNLDDFTKEMNR